MLVRHFMLHGKYKMSLKNVRVDKSKMKFNSVEEQPAPAFVVFRPSVVKFYSQHLTACCSESLHVLDASQLKLV